MKTIIILFTSLLVCFCDSSNSTPDDTTGITITTSKGSIAAKLVRPNDSLINDSVAQIAFLYAHDKSTIIDSIQINNMLTIQFDSLPEGLYDIIIVYAEFEVGTKHNISVSSNSITTVEINITININNYTINNYFYGHETTTSSSSTPLINESSAPNSSFIETGNFLSRSSSQNDGVSNFSSSSFKSDPNIAISSSYDDLFQSSTKGTITISSSSALHISSSYSSSSKSMVIFNGQQELLIEGQWSTGWSSVKLFTPDSNSFLFALSDNYGWVNIHPLNNDGTYAPKTFQASWSQGWSELALYSSASNQYVMVYKKLSGSVTVHKMNTDGSIDTSYKYNHTIDPGWTSIEPYYIGEQCFLIFSGGKLGLQIYQTHENGALKPGNYSIDTNIWANAQVINSSGSPFLFASNTSDSSIIIQAIDSAGAPSGTPIAQKLTHTLDLMKLYSHLNNDYISFYDSEAGKSFHYQLASGQIGSLISESFNGTDFTGWEMYQIKNNLFTFFINENSGDYKIFSVN